MPRIIDHDDRRREIIEVAKRIIIKGGYEAATMRSIAEEAGFANGALKHYFPNKDSIIAATFMSVLMANEDSLEQQGLIPGVSADRFRTMSAIDRLRAYLHATMGFDDNEKGEARILLALWEYSLSNDVLAELYRAHLTEWRGQIVSFMEAAAIEGSVRLGLPYGELADEFISVVIGASVVRLLRGEGMMVPDYPAYVEELLARLQ